MFGKKILSLIGSLFIAARFVKADNALTTTCVVESTKGDCGGSFTHYCISGTNIYAMGNNCNSVQLGEGVHVFEVATPESDVKKIDLTNGGASVTGGNEGKLAVYVCDGNKDCALSAGYIKVGAAYYKVTTTSSSTYNVVSDQVSCSSSNIGDLVTTSNGVAVCLAAGKDVVLPAGATSGNYFLGVTNAEVDDLLVGESPFKGVSSSKLSLSGIAIAASQGALVFNSKYTATYDCNDSDDLKLTDRLTNLCQGTDCAKYYSCTDGVCDEQTSVCPRGGSGTDVTTDPVCDPTKGSSSNCNTDGYYLVNTGDIVTAPGSGDLYHCSGGVCDEKINSPTQVGYLWNAAFDAAEGHNAPFLQCSAGSCQAIAVTKTSCGSETGDTIAKDGELFTADAGTTYSICLDAAEVTGVSLGLDGSLTSNTPFFMSVATAGNIFDLGSGTTTYVVLSVNTKDVLLDTAADNALYRYSDETYKIFTRSEANTDTTGVCKKTGTLIEFIHLCSGETNYDASASYYTKGETKNISDA